MFTHESECPHGLQFQLFVEIKGILKVTGSHVLFKSESISETV